MQMYPAGLSDVFVNLLQTPLSLHSSKMRQASNVCLHLLSCRDKPADGFVSVDKLTTDCLHIQ